MIFHEKGLAQWIMVWVWSQEIHLQFTCRGFLKYWVGVFLIRYRYSILWFKFCDEDCSFHSMSRQHILIYVHQTRWFKYRSTYTYTVCLPIHISKGAEPQFKILFDPKKSEFYSDVMSEFIEKPFQRSGNFQQISIFQGFSKWYFKI